ncbi:PEP-CTERM sorting domain-containing protein [Lacipirellula sp.]|uniref:PEP-CTERM sorting domain-containing protein n=1 Tax=Lacipirellula sp. TaxID=2691419 RepID=UPI003D125127
MRTAALLTFASLAAWLTLAAPSHAVNLVANGGFETGTFAGWTLNGTPSTLFNVSNFEPHSGQYAMFIADYESDHDQISQVVPSVNGQGYTLEFWLRNFEQGNDGLQVFWEGSLVLEQKPVLAPVDLWTKYSLPVTATTNGSELRLGGFDVPNSIYFDDISVTQIPEPSTLLLVVAGVAVLVKRGMRRSI